MKALAVLGLVLLLAIGLIAAAQAEPAAEKMSELVMFTPGK
jgi:hypothetical protein